MSLQLACFSWVHFLHMPRRGRESIVAVVVFVKFVQALYGLMLVHRHHALGVQCFCLKLKPVSFNERRHSHGDGTYKDPDDFSDGGTT